MIPMEFWMLYLFGKAPATPSASIAADRLRAVIAADREAAQEGRWRPLGCGLGPAMGLAYALAGFGERTVRRISDRRPRYRWEVRR